jgi:hypothetical protein
MCQPGSLPGSVHACRHLRHLSEHVHVQRVALFEYVVALHCLIPGGATSYLQYVRLQAHHMCCGPM